MTEQLLLDRLDGAQAVLESEDGTTVRIPATWLPAGSQEGHTLQVGLEPAPGGTTIRLELLQADDEPTKVSTGA